MAGILERLPDFLHVRVMGHFHGDDTDTVFACELKHPGQTRGAVALEGIGVGPWLVGTHPGANLPLFLKKFHHGFNIGGVVHSAQARENMKRVLIKAHPVVGESRIPDVPGMAADHPVFPRDPHHLFNARQAFNLRLIERGDIPDDVNLRQGPVGAGNAVRSGRDTGFAREIRHHGFALVGIEGTIGVQNDNHGEVPVVTGVSG